MIQALDRGLQVLEILSQYESLSVTELAANLGVDKSTVSRTLETLKHHDLVQLNKNTKKYKLGFRILHLGEALKKNLNIIDISHPIMKEAADELGQSVHLCAYNNKTVYVIDQVVREKTYFLSATIGMIEPIHASSVGKCILAHRREDILSQILENYEYTKYTEKTIQDKAGLLHELEKVKKQGYAVDDEEVALGVRCVAVPIFNYGKQVRYSIGISGMTALMTEENMNLYIKKLGHAAKKIGKELGYGSFS